jgi:hypothetical protein
MCLGDTNVSRYAAIIERCAKETDSSAIDEFMEALFEDKPDGMLYHVIGAFFQDGGMTMDLVWPFVVLGGESGNQTVRDMLSEDIFKQIVGSEEAGLDKKALANRLFDYGSRGDVTDKGRKWVYAMSKLIADSAGIEVCFRLVNCQVSLDASVSMEVDEASEVETIVVEETVEVKDVETVVVEEVKPAGVKRKASEADKSSPKEKKAKKGSKKAEVHVVEAAVEEVIDEVAEPMVIEKVELIAPVVEKTPVVKKKNQKKSKKVVAPVEEVIVAPIVEKVGAPVVPVVEKVEAPVVAKVVSKKGGKKAKKPKATVEEEAVIDKMLESQMNDPTPSQKKSQKVKIQAEIATMETPAVENIAPKKAAASSKSTTPSKKSLTWGPNKVKEFDLKISIGKAPTALKPASPGRGLLKKREAGAGGDVVVEVGEKVEVVEKIVKKKRVGKGGKRR